MFRRGICKHFCGVSAKQCKLGLTYSRVIAESEQLGYSAELPCIQDLGPGDRGQHVPGYCAKYEDPGGADISAMVDIRVEDSSKEKYVQPLVDEIVQRAAGKDYDGYVKCPVCCGKVFVVYESHKQTTIGRCESVGCLRWRKRGIN